MSQKPIDFVLKETCLLKKEITCTICLDIFTEPITLTTCQHTFCLECFKNLFSNQTNPFFECPLCKKLTNRRSYYVNEQFVATVELLKMYDKLLNSIDKAGSEKNDDIYDRENRMMKYLNDCITFDGQYGTEECVSLSSEESDSKPDDLNPKLKINHNRSLKVPKATKGKTKPLNCTKVKGKFAQKRKTKTGKNTNIGDTINIDEYDSPDVGVLEKEENKIVKLLEEDFLRNIENEAQIINKIEEDKNELLDKKEEKKDKQKKQQKHESNFNWNSKSAESSSSKKTAISTGWSRMKTMKKQIKKKEVKYKQLNVSTEINKSKSKSPLDKNTKQICKESNPEVINVDDDEIEISEIRDTSVHAKTDDILKDKLDLLLQCVDENLNKNNNQNEDIFSMCTQKLQNPKQINSNEIEILSPENKTSRQSILSDTENNVAEFIVNVQVHNCSTPVKISEKEMVENDVTVATNINKSNKNVTSNERKSSEETVDVISATERTPEPVIRRSLRKNTKRNSDENSAVQKKISPKKRKLIKSNIKRKSVDVATNDINISNLQNENNDIINEETLNINKNISEESIKENSKIVKNELKIVSEQKTEMISALQSSMNAITVVLSQCSNYINSESLFSESLPTKEDKNSNSNPKTTKEDKNFNSNSKTTKEDKNSNSNSKTNKQPIVLLERFYSLPAQSNSRSSIEFYGTVIPCLQKIEDYYKQIISLSQQVTTDTENFRSTFNENKKSKDVLFSISTKSARNVEVQTDNTENFRSTFNEDKKSEDVLFSISAKSAKNVEVQTDNVKCPNCSCIIDFKSVEKSAIVEDPSINDGFKEINDLDNISKHFSFENKIQSKDSVGQSKENNSFNTLSKENSEKSAASDLVHTKKVNRQLTYSDNSNNSQKRKFKRIRSPTPDSDSESVKSKKSNTNYCKLLYRDDIDIFFQSEPLENINNLSLSSSTSDKEMQKLKKKHEKLLMDTLNEEKDSSVNPEDTTSKYISILEREYKEAQFDKVSKSEQLLEKQNFDSAPNTVLDKLLGSINLSFDNDNFELEKNTNKTAPLFTETEQKNTSSEKKADNSIPVVQSTSMFHSANVVNKTSDVDKTKSIEKLENIGLAAQKAAEKELDKEVENLTNPDLIVDDSLGSDKDMFGDDNFVESTPEKFLKNEREKNKLKNTEQLLLPVLDILEPPPSVTENLDWIDIAPPPPLEFQDTEQVEKSVLNNPNISSITPDIFALNPLNQGFFLSGNITNSNIKEQTQINLQKSVCSENIIPNSTNTQQENQETIAPKNKITIPSNTESTIWKSTKRNLNPIVLAQKEKFSPLQIIVNPNPSPKQTISLTPKHQSSILNYYQTPQKENNANDFNKKLSKSGTPAKLNVNNKQNSFVPITENLPVEVHDSPVPQNNVPSCSSAIENKSSNELKNSSSGRSNNQVCIAWTRLKRDETMLIMSLTQKLKSKHTKNLDEKVTHLVVSVDDCNKVKDHTMKYILAIAHSIWIVSPTWVQECIRQNQFISEEPYEVLDVSGRQGPKMSRLTRLSKPLLSNFVFCFIEPFTSVLKTDLETVVTNLGGKIVSLPSHLSYQVGKNCLILAEAKETHDFDQFQDWRDTLSVLIIDIEWLFRTVGQYQITSVRPYILCLDTDINNLGYPFAMIAPVPDTPSQMTMTNTNH